MIRNSALDYLKLILSFLVIFIHIQNETFDNPEYNHLFSEGISRIAVPCFFIINGYFFFENIKTKTALLAYLKKLLTLWIIWNLVYIPFWYESFTNNQLLDKILFIINGYFHLWYLSALIFVSILVYYLSKMKFNEKLIAIYSILFFITGYLLQNNENEIVSNPSFMFIKSEYISRNFLTLGFPFFYIGFYLKKKEIIIKLANLLILFIIGFGFLLLEFFHNESLHFKTDFLFSTLVVSPIIFLIALNKKDRIKDLKIKRYLNFSKISTNIYFLHVMVIFLLPETPIILIFLYSFALSFLIIKIKDYFVKKTIFSNFIMGK